MNTKHVVARRWLVAGMALWMAPVLGAENTAGRWTVRSTDVPATVQLSLKSAHPRLKYSANQPVEALHGLDLSEPAARESRFTITRDAGRFECRGTLSHGHGQGEFTFITDSRYASTLRTLGVEGVSADLLPALAAYGVSLEFVHGLQERQVEGLNASMLIALRANHVDLAQVSEWQTLAYTPDASEFITLQVNGVTPFWARQLKELGYDRLDIATLVALRVNAVSPEFITRLNALGYVHPRPADLIALRVRNITPERIAALQAQGYADLTMEQIVDRKHHPLRVN